MAQFERYIGVDYSGAETPDSSCKGLRVYVAEGTGTPGLAGTDLHGNHDQSSEFGIGDVRIQGVSGRSLQ
jgi:hypothetical protein